MLHTIRYAMGAAVTAVALMAQTATAQSIPPFAAMPGDAIAVARMDFQAMENAPVLSPVMQRVRAESPDYKRELMSGVGEMIDPSLSGLVEQFGAATQIIEAGTAEVDMDLDPQAQDSGTSYLTVYGQFDPAAIFEQLSAGGWESAGTYGDLTLLRKPGAEHVLTMANDYTVLLANSDAHIRAMIDTHAGQRPSVMTSGTPTGRMAAQAATSPLMGVVFFPEPARRMMVDGMNEAMEMQGVSAEEIKSQTGVDLELAFMGTSTIGLSLTPAADNVTLGMAMEFTSPEATRTVTGTYPMIMSQVGGLLGMMDPGSGRVRDLGWALATAQPTINGNQAIVAIPIPAATIADLITAADQFQQMQMQMQ